METAKSELAASKSELATSKSELEALKATKSTVDSTVEELQAQLKSAEAERSSLIHKFNDRGRIAMDFKKKFVTASNKLEELTKNAEAAASASTSVSYPSISTFLLRNN